MGFVHGGVLRIEAKRKYTPSALVLLLFQLHRSFRAASDVFTLCSSGVVIFGNRDGGNGGSGMQKDCHKSCVLMLLLLCFFGERDSGGS